MIFVTVGSQKFQFNRLLSEIDKLIYDGEITEDVYAQIGYSTYKPKNYRFIDFLDDYDFKRKIAKSDLVICHGGSGVIMTAVKKGKKVIAIPRKKEYGEHVDNHQYQIVKQFEECGLILACYEADQLIESLGEKSRKTVEYNSKTEEIIRDIFDYIKGGE